MLINMNNVDLDLVKLIYSLNQLINLILNFLMDIMFKYLFF